ncbi:hypothetical protein F5883DRAFT_436898, partial [Diaporthe sp. PMI_573]
EFSCGHHHSQVASWCPTYERTGIRCPPVYIYYEYDTSTVCGECKPTILPPWYLSLVKK